MIQTILIAGADNILGGHLAARYLATSDHCLVILAPPAGYSFAEELRAFVVRAMGKITPQSAAIHRDQAGKRLHIFSATHGGENRDILPGDLRINTIWYLSGGHYEARHRNLEFRKALAMLLHAGVTEFNYAGSACTATPLSSDVEHAKRNRNSRDAGLFGSIEQEVIQTCEANKVDYRIFRAPLILGEDCGLPPRGYNDFLHFSAALCELKTEIQARSPDYFEFHSLRFLAQPDAALDLLSAEAAAESMLHIARQEGTLRRVHAVAGPGGIAFEDFCDWIGTVYEIGFLPAGDYNELNEIDLVFQERLSWFRNYLAPQHGAVENGARAPSQSAISDQKQYRKLLETVCRSQQAAHISKNPPANGLSVHLEQRRIARNGVEFSYFGGGSQGDAVILLNALGQGLRYWHSLINRLLHNRRVIIWELRGTVSPPHPFGLADQVDDLEAILQQEGIEACHLVGWCTGPKVAIQFYLRRPEAVLSMVFLNSTFKCLGISSEDTTDYENNIESLCRILQTRPAMAGTVMRSLQSTLDVNGSGQLDGEMNILSLVNMNLKHDIIAPFRDEATTLNYAHQLIDFVSYDAIANAPLVKAPILLVASEHDKVSAPSMSHTAAKLFPHARCIEVKGATHYCLYDRPDLIAGLVEDFLLDPASLPGSIGEVFQIA